MIDVQKISDIVRYVAATEIMPRFRNLQEGEIREKNPGDFVTIADEESEKVFTRLLAEQLPGSLVVGEEAVAKDSRVLDLLKDDRPVWVIDPVDGTYNFSHGRSHFGVLIALVQKGETLGGWMFDAPGNRMVVAEKGSGAYLDGGRLKISCGKSEVKELIGQAGGAQAWHFDAIRPFFHEVRNYRCSLHDYLSFLTGAADFIVHINKQTPWDHAAPNLAAAEAGAFTGMGDDGGPYDPTRFGPAFMITAPDRDWYDQLFPILYPQLKRRQA